MEGDQIRGRPTPGGSARTRERMRQSLLHTEHVAPSRAASHSLLGMLAVQAGVHGQRDQSLPAPHAPTLALGERLLATGARGARLLATGARASHLLATGARGAPAARLSPRGVARPLRGLREESARCGAPAARESGRPASPRRDVDGSAGEWKSE